MCVNFLLNISCSVTVDLAFLIQILLYLRIILCIFWRTCGCLFYLNGTGQSGFTDRCRNLRCSSLLCSNFACLAYSSNFFVAGFPFRHPCCAIYLQCVCLACFYTDFSFIQFWLCFLWCRLNFCHISISRKSCRSCCSHQKSHQSSTQNLFPFSFHFPISSYTFCLFLIFKI